MRIDTTCDFPASPLAIQAEAGAAQGPKDIPAIISAAMPDARNDALRMLDEITCPLTIRDLDEGLRAYGLTRKERRAIQFATRHLTIIALVRR